MQIQSRLTSAEIAINSVLVSSPFEADVGDGQHVGRARFMPSNTGEHVRRPPMSRAEQVTLTYRTRDDRLAVIAHELRNSLSVVCNAVRLFGAQQAGSGVMEGARRLIERQVSQMSRLIEDLLDGSRGTGREFLQRQRIDLCVLVRQVIEGVELDFRRRGHRLTVNMPDYPVWLDADPGRLEQVFSNLLINAAKYSYEGGDITVTVERRLEYASVRINDEGIGIAAELLPRVFGLFVQAEPAATHSRAGHGIGLAVVRNLVDMHGGSVTAASDGLERGSEFTVLLPALWT